MAIILTESAKNSAFNNLISAMHYSGGNTTFELTVDGTSVASFTRIVNDWLASGGKLIYDSFSKLLFTVPIGTTGVNGIRLKGSFLNGTQTVSTWALSTPENFPNGGTFELSKYEMTAITE